MRLTTAVIGLVILTGIYLFNQNKQYREEIQSLKITNAACEARTKNILEDKISDETVDKLLNDDLRIVPDDWLR